MAAAASLGSFALSTAAGAKILYLKGSGVHGANGDELISTGNLDTGVSSRGPRDLLSAPIPRSTFFLVVSIGSLHLDR